MSWLEAVVLGVVQGLTEFLPVSSTAHVSLAGRLFFGGDPTAAFSAVIQLGTTAAMIIYFWRDIWRIAKAWVLSLFGRVPRDDPDARLGWFIVVGSIPIAVLGLLFQNAITSTLRNLWITVAMLLGVGIVLLVADLHAAGLAERAARQPRRALGASPQGLKTLTRMTWRDAVILGVSQAAALIPGVSRSGATTSAGLFLGYDRPSAARYSFLLSIPAVLASGLFELKGIGGTDITWGPTIVATVISFVVGFGVIAWLLRYVSTHTFLAFAVYRMALALVVAGLLLTGILAASA